MAEELSPEEIQNLQTKVAEAEKELTELRPLKDSSEKTKQEFVDKEKSWEVEKKRLEQAVHPEWPKTRQIINDLIKIAKDKGVEVDDAGNIISNPQNVDIEKIRQEATNAAKREILGGRLEESLEAYDPESKDIVRHYYDKVTAGETVTLRNIDNFVKQAEAAAKVGSGKEIKRAFTYSGGQGPRDRSEKEGVLDDATAKEIGKRLNLPFATAEDKK